jgi:hypothetical protein
MQFWRSRGQQATLEQSSVVTLVGEHRQVPPFYIGGCL